MKHASKHSKGKKNNEDDDMLMQAENTVTSHYPVNPKTQSLEEMFDRMEIKVVGKNNEEVKSDHGSDDI